MKIVIFGSTGMAGHVIYEYLSARPDFDIVNVSYRNKFNNFTKIVDVNDQKLVEELINLEKPDIIVNCIGILLKGAKEDAANAIYVNSYFPHFLHKVAVKSNCKVIHISTDCVFSGKKGEYLPDDIKDAQDIYGMSKALGELINDRDLTIRTSIIGPELKRDGEGLLHWFLTQEGEINGYTEAFWSGITTLELAKIVERAIDNNIIGLLQCSNGEKISKYALLKLFQESFGKKNVEIIPIPGKNVDKSLLPTINNHISCIPGYKSMCDELNEYIRSRFNLYKQYNFFQPK